MSRDPDAIRDAARRLAVLRLLDESRRRTADEATLRHLLRGLGHAAGRPSLRADLEYLRERDAVAIEDIGGVWLATLTGRGEDVAHGDEALDGVARPEPAA